MMIIANWRLVQWVIVIILVILLVLRLVGIIPFFPIWVYLLIIAIAIWPQILIFAVLGAIAWVALQYARARGGSGNNWSDR